MLVRFIPSPRGRRVPVTGHTVTAHPDDRHLHCHPGFWQLTAIAVSGVTGSGWLLSTGAGAVLTAIFAGGTGATGGAEATDGAAGTDGSQQATKRSEAHDAGDAGQ
jgi:hypothetical protein